MHAAAASPNLHDHMHAAAVSPLPEHMRQIDAANVVLGDGDAFLQVDGQVPPAPWDKDELPTTHDALHWPDLRAWQREGGKGLNVR